MNQLTFLNQKIRNFVMTYSGTQSQSDEHKLVKANIEQAVLDSVRRQLETVELTVESDNQKYVCTTELTNTDIYKLVRSMNDEEKIVEINDTINSRLIIGSIDQIDSSSGKQGFPCPNNFILSKTTFCLDNDLIEGCLIISGNKLPHYAEPQKDDIYRSTTIGKVLQIYTDRCIYFDMTNEQRTAGEYELSKTKRLQLNTNPVINRRPSISISSRTTRAPTPTPTQRTTGQGKAALSLTLSRRPSVSSQSLPTPRTIMRFRLVRYI